MNNQDCLSIVCKAARIYAENLLDKTFLFVGRNNTTGAYTYFEVGFEKRHFLHLTGLSTISTINSDRFFDLCIAGRISVRDIDQFPFGQSLHKLEVLPMLMSIPWRAKMIGDYNNCGDCLFTEKIAGNTTGCMGFVTQNDLQYKVPNTVLKADIRDVTNGTKQVIAVYQKNTGDAFYAASPIFVVKNLQGKELRWPDELACLIEKPLATSGTQDN